MSVYHDFFERIYVINLEKRKGRMEYFNNVFCPSVGIDCTKVTRFNAIENNKDGMIGCTLSHFAIIEECHRDKVSNVLVFEDDVQYGFGDENDLIHALNDSVENDWDMLYLGCANNRQASPQTENIDRCKNVWTTHAMSINNTIFEKIVEETNSFKIKTKEMKKCPYNEAIDHYYSHKPFHENNVFVSTKYFLRQKLFGSDISKKRVPTFFKKWDKKVKRHQS